MDWFWCRTCLPYKIALCFTRYSCASSQYCVWRRTWVESILLDVVVVDVGCRACQSPSGHFDSPDPPCVWPDRLPHLAKTTLMFTIAMITAPGAISSEIATNCRVVSDSRSLPLCLSPHGSRVSLISPRSFGGGGGFLWNWHREKVWLGCELWLPFSIAVVKVYVVMRGIANLMEHSNNHLLMLATWELSRTGNLFAFLKTRIDCNLYGSDHDKRSAIVQCERVYLW